MLNGFYCQITHTEVSLYKKNEEKKKYQKDLSPINQIILFHKEDQKNHNPFFLEIKNTTHGRKTLIGKHQTL